MNTKTQTKPKGLAEPESAQPYKARWHDPENAPISLNICLKHLEIALKGRDEAKAQAKRLAEALKDLLNKIDNITSDQFALAAEKSERESARKALAQWEAGQ
jgi:hypothetical protein